MLSWQLRPSAFLLPIPVMVLGTLVCIVQVLVFCLLTSIYITLATEHEEHDSTSPPSPGHGRNVAIALATFAKSD